MLGSGNVSDWPLFGNKNFLVIKILGAWNLFQTPNARNLSYFSAFKMYGARHLVGVRLNRKIMCPGFLFIFLLLLVTLSNFREETLSASSCYSWEPTLVIRLPFPCFVRVGTVIFLSTSWNGFLLLPVTVGSNEVQWQMLGGYKSIFTTASEISGRRCISG